MKKIFTPIAITILCFNISHSQEEKSWFKFYSISISPLSIYLDNHSGGLSGSMDISFKKDEHIFKLFGFIGSEFAILQSSTESFYEFDLLYGRELFLKKWLYIDLYGGLGYFGSTVTTGIVPSGLFSYSEYKHDRSGTIGLHLQSKIRFKTGSRFSLGIQFHTNVNSINTIYSLGTFFQWDLTNKEIL